MDMNENSPNQGVSIDELLKVIGLRDVEGYVRDQNMAKQQEQLIAMSNQIISLNAEIASLKAKAPEPPSVNLELEQLRKSNSAGEARVKQLEQQVHSVALERDAARAKMQSTDEALTKALNDGRTLQYECDDLQKEVDELKKTRKGKPRG